MSNRMYNIGFGIGFLLFVVCAGLSAGGVLGFNFLFESLKLDDPMYYTALACTGVGFLLISGGLFTGTFFLTRKETERKRGFVQGFLVSLGIIGATALFIGVCMLLGSIPDIKKYM